MSTEKKAHSAPKKESEQFVVPRDGMSDLKFRGQLVAKVDTYDPHHPIDVDPVRNVVTHQGSRRWKEWAIYRTETGTFVCQKLGRTRMPSEVDQSEAKVVGKEGVELGTLERIARHKDRFSANEAIIEFFGRDGLAKELYAAAGIEDVEEIQ